MVYNQPATIIYSSLINGNIVEFRDATESCGNIQNYKINSSDQRTTLNTLLSVDQQYEMPDYKQYVPYGYKYLGETMLGYKVYQNEYSLGWGYTYDHSVSYDVASQLDGLGVQELMMSSVILDRAHSKPNMYSSHTPISVKAANGKTVFSKQAAVEA